jgi:hypothetical protein
LKRRAILECPSGTPLSGIQSVSEETEHCRTMNTALRGLPRGSILGKPLEGSRGDFGLQVSFALRTSNFDVWISGVRGLPPPPPAKLWSSPVSSRCAPQLCRPPPKSQHRASAGCYPPNERPSTVLTVFALRYLRPSTRPGRAPLNDRP